jgi:hypothetical protein
MGEDGSRWTVVGAVTTCLGLVVHSGHVVLEELELLEVVLVVHSASSMLELEEVVVVVVVVNHALSAAAAPTRAATATAANFIFGAWWI